MALSRILCVSILNPKVTRSKLELTLGAGKLKDRREAAVQRLYEHNCKQMEQFVNEIEILTRLRHINLVTLYGCTSRVKDRSLTWPVCMNIAIETAGALAYLRASDVIHCDIKTNNILLDHNFSVKVADFGISRLFPNYVSQHTPSSCPTRVVMQSLHLEGEPRVVDELERGDNHVVQPRLGEVLEGSPLSLMLSSSLVMSGVPPVKSAYPSVTPVSSLGTPQTPSPIPRSVLTSDYGVLRLKAQPSSMLPPQMGS
ncbi:hypothetical protein FXO38_30238 [Capsicum annuum]|nr:hypothetical protein FXO38_30238 [Capsicum annuum]KAF3685230.1 hypothetical protein FXO37_00829 [Capsicum annuum]